MISKPLFSYKIHGYWHCSYTSRGRRDYGFPTTSPYFLLIEKKKKKKHLAGNRMF